MFKFYRQTIKNGGLNIISIKTQLLHNIFLNWNYLCWGPVIIISFVTDDLYCIAQLLKEYVQRRNECHGAVITFGECSSKNRPRNILERERHVMKDFLLTRTRRTGKTAAAATTTTTTTITTNKNNTDAATDTTPAATNTTTTNNNTTTKLVSVLLKLCCKLAYRLLVQAE